jgi:hypothetical protein
MRGVFESNIYKQTNSEPKLHPIYGVAKIAAFKARGFNSGEKAKPPSLPYEPGLDPISWRRRSMRAILAEHLAEKHT